MPDSADEIQRQLQANDDPYLDERWGVLANKVAARTQEDLDAAEHDLAEFRALELAAEPIPPSFDERHLRAIHRHLFQDVYEWAGEWRTVNTSKPDDPAAFFPCQRFAVGVPATFEQIAERDFRPGMPVDEFVNKLTRTYDEVNHLHLFREGNGRAQRIFLTQLAEHSGFTIDWNAVTAQQNDAVCRAAGHGDREPMKAMLASVVHPMAGAGPAPRLGRDPQLQRDARRTRQADPAGLENAQTDASPRRARPRLADQARIYVERQEQTAQERSQTAKTDPGSMERSVGTEGMERS
ncbi:Fic family protein [Kribbella sp. NPDC050820]|uniref:Fic/DOC family protein n=1 Tax=Kribbella sp. NPDC050820 TaxID=3155408 RepID=UPI0033DDEFF5